VAVRVGSLVVVEQRLSSVNPCCLRSRGSVAMALRGLAVNVPAYFAVSCTNAVVSADRYCHLTLVTPAFLL
jgi:hypothetical protein